MRKRDLYMGGLFWAMVATLMPLTALEPVSAHHSDSEGEGFTYLTSLCDDGSASLAMGCASIHL